MLSKRRRVLALSGALLASFGGDFDHGSAEQMGKNRSQSGIRSTQLDDEPAVTADVQDLVDANATFAFELLDVLAAEAGHENQFVSPLSISNALAMMWAGALGETEREMADTLRFALEQTDLHPAFEDLLSELDERSDRDVEGDPLELDITNAIWGQEGYSFQEAYLDLIANHYNAELQELDFEGAPEDSREQINAWVEERTGNRIDEILPEGAVDMRTVFVLTNAVYFRAGWRLPFNEDVTGDATFTALDGLTDEIPMMAQYGWFPYAEVDDHQLVELSYVGGASMLIILPAEGRYEEFERELDADQFSTLVGELRGNEGAIRLPRFAVESSFQLSDALSVLGMNTAFAEGDADFTGIVEDGELWIDEVYHDAFVTVDEEGTEATAATAIADEDTAVPDPFEMTVDRPFLFAIRDDQTNALLFLGRVVDIPSDPAES